MSKPAMQPALQLVTDTQAYFHELLCSTLSRQQVTTLPETEYYLVQLLNEFLLAERLTTDEPLVLMVKEALEANDAQQRKKLFKHTGDVSLYMAGFFQDNLAQKKVDLTYYMHMGGNAYRQAAHLSVGAKETQHRCVFLEMAEKFADLVDVLADVGDRTLPKTEQNLLRIYELWEQTQSKRAARTLQQAGILLNPISIKRGGGN